MKSSLKKTLVTVAMAVTMTVSFAPGSDASTRTEVDLRSDTEITFSAELRDTGETTQAALPTGTCSGVAECNDFIAECVGAGGDYVPIHDHETSGEPNLGSCKPSA